MAKVKLMAKCCQRPPHKAKDQITKKIKKIMHKCLSFSPSSNFQNNKIHVTIYGYLCIYENCKSESIFSENCKKQTELQTRKISISITTAQMGIVCNWAPAHVPNQQHLYMISVQHKTSTHITLQLSSMHFQKFIYIHIETLNSLQVKLL